MPSCAGKSFRVVFLKHAKKIKKHTPVAINCGLKSMVRNNLRQEIKSLEDALAELTISAQSIRRTIIKKQEQLDNSGGSDDDHVPTGKRDNDGRFLYIGDRVKVLTKSVATAQFYGVKTARIVRCDLNWIYLVSLDHKEGELPKKGKRQSSSLRSLDNHGS